MSYLEDYELETKKLQELIAEREHLVPQILDAQRRVMALATLLDLHRDDEPMTGMDMVGAALKRGRLTDAVRHLLTESGQPLTTKDLVTELRRLGFPMEDHTNPAATVNSIGNRLVEQGFAVEAQRSGKKGKAWVRKKADNDLISDLRKAAEQSRIRNQDAIATKADARRAVTQREVLSRH
jgi:hypothetical protein